MQLSWMVSKGKWMRGSKKYKDHFRSPLTCFPVVWNRRVSEFVQSRSSRSSQFSDMSPTPFPQHTKGKVKEHVPTRQYQRVPERQRTDRLRKDSKAKNGKTKDAAKGSGYIKEKVVIQNASFSKALDYYHAV
ncbi:hypothetical protein PM082_022638 [Marasmius tenuissimus]|nr:hypothetical protein PM082_022638 [Marasmius tenuissimus]